VAKQQKKDDGDKLTPQEYRSQLKQVQLDEIMLEECSAKIRRDRLEKSLEIQIDQKVTHVCLSNTRVVVNHSYKLTASGHGAKKDFALKVTCSFGLKYSSEAGISEDFMEIFKVRNIPLNTWPYFREFIQSITQRMNIPPLTLPLLKQ